MKEQDKKNEEKEFPGYPHYPANEDIMNSKDNERLDVNVENLSRSPKISSSALPDKSVKPASEETTTPPLADVDSDDIDAAGPAETDLTADDLIALGEDEVDYGNREEPGSDLDVPGSEEDDADEEIGEEDEENNYYSLGGDAHEDLEEDKS